MSRYDLVTFDLDDTIWPLREVIIEADRKMRAWIDARAPGTFTDMPTETLQAIRQQLVKDEPELATDLSAARVRTMTIAFEHCGLAANEARALAEGAFEVFFTGRNEVVWFDDAEPLFKALAERGIVMGGLSNGNADMHLTGLHRHFEFHLSAADVAANKPDPAMFHAALGRTGVAAARTLHVGDSVTADVMGARNAGVDAVWLNRDGAPRPTELPAQVVEIRSLAEVLALLH